MKEALSHFPATWMTCTALLLFFAVFVGMSIWVFRKDRKGIYEKTSQLPLQEEGSSI